MSGGSLCDYKQYVIDEIADRIEEEIANQTKPEPPKVKRKYVRCKVVEENGAWHYEYLYDCKTLAEGEAKVRQNRNVYKRHDRLFRADAIWFDGKWNRNRQELILEEREEEEVDWDRDDCEEYCYGERYSEETMKEFREAVKVLRKAAVYAQRIDWLVSGDDCEESFRSRLKEELEKI